MRQQALPQSRVIQPAFFDPGLPPLKEVLLDRYIEPAARWLIGDPDSPYLLPQGANSSWECALAAWHLLDLYAAFGEQRALGQRIPAKVCHTARWILDQAQEDSAGRFHWEGVTWDTAVCVRAVLRVAEELPERFSQQDHEEIRRVCSRGLAWLLHRFSVWDSEIIYPYGPADVAQILEALLYVKRRWPELMEGVADPTVQDLDQAIDDIATYLFAAKDNLDREGNANGSPPGLAFWSDFFQSGEVIDCLSQYATYADEARQRAKCEEHVFHCIRYFELHQVNGQWGAHVDTCRALYGYLRATHAIPVARQENHIVMKALRWMCDDKQRFNDGSFLHTPFVTVFYVAALWEAYAHWPLAEMSVGAAYDVALWSAPVRATEERGLRLALEIEKEHLIAEAKAADRRVNQAAAVLASQTVAMVGVAVAVLVGVIDISVSSKDVAATLSFFAIVVAIMVGLTGYAARGGARYDH